MTKLLVVEDDLKLNQIVCSYLTDYGFTVKGCLNPNEAYVLLYGEHYDLVISDIMMPFVDGFEFAKTVRSLNKTIPILFVSARDDIISKQKGFRIGIDDYMVKPVDLNELILRVEALLRRANILGERKVVVGGLVLDADTQTATVDEEKIPLTGREFAILFKLLSYPQKTFSRAQLMDEFWGLESKTSLQAVDVYIMKLREKFSQQDDFEIATVHGIGYKAVLK
ncbi:response regulator transcription factor [Trichococcus ilyis]|uniref:Heme response regulator HssR n=1 Tax=Trichococcus ilyis TaxID=640938 RepID=A0A143YT50_9LACT|nr:response regulator transcription factor [Trichococcus ilyis]CZQ96457.1 transcriptional regulatory protein c terminal [Trichococcus ilyis]SEJ51732.1 DNA-binding response regulator, OmpR family, contains REC and winged-helix (wHTH) domain [Trichococcus ilyis]